MIGLDTTAIIDLFKGDESLNKLLRGLEDTFTTSIINYQEIFFGVTNEKDYIEEVKYYDSFFLNIEILQLNQISARKSSEIYWKLKNKGIEIGKFDCIIAGIFLTEKVNKIITKNKKHFENIKDIEVLSY